MNKKAEIFSDDYVSFYDLRLVRLELNQISIFLYFKIIEF